MKKAQLFTTDLFIALSIFIILIGIVFLTWARYNAKLNEDINFEDMQIKAFQITDLLTKTEGYPIAWEKNISSLEVIGLMESERNLSLAKVQNFTSLDYNLTRQLFNIELYDFYFTIKSINGSKLLQYGVINDEELVNLRRIANYGNQKAIMEFTISK